MKFGKLPSIDLVDFNLPPNPIENEALLSQIPKTDKLPKLYVGCTGWSMKEWIGTVYPKSTKTKDYLKHYSRQFNTIEFNSTHYRIPSPENIKKWRTESLEDFKFCPKIPQSISHSLELGNGSDTIKIFCEAIVGLEEKRGCCFMQLPPYFDKNRIVILEAFLDQFPDNIQLAVEARHESWFHPGENALFDLLQKYNTSTVITDVAGRRDVLHQRLTNGTAMVRFVGNDLHPTDYERADSWIAQLKTWYQQGLKKVYFFTHEPDNIQAPEMADYFVKAAQKELEVEVRGPSFYDINEGRQISLF